MAVEQGGIQFFGKVDHSTKGTVQSTYPAWYFNVLQDELKDSINRMDRQLEMELVPASEIPIMKKRLRDEKARLQEIQMSRPKLSGVQKDRISKVRKELGEKIREAMFTRTDMKKGIADAHEEATRMSEPCIELSPDESEIASACNIRMEGKKVSRTGAEKVWKIISKALDEPTNTETLRRD